MNALIIFQKKNEDLLVSELSEAMNGLLGVDCALLEPDSGANGTLPPSDTAFRGGMVRVNFPDIDEEAEGIPVVSVKLVPRKDRDADLKEILDALIAQDPSLEGPFCDNARDFYLFHEETPAAAEAAYVLAYVLGLGTSSGILIPSTEDDMQTVWFEDPEDFADVVFGDGDDDDEEDGEDDGDGTPADDDF